MSQPDTSDIVLDRMLSRIRALKPRLACSDPELLEIYWRFHPRFQFLKTVCANAALLDIGAGSGGLAQWKSWLQPRRDDIVCYGVDQAPNPESSLYRSWECVDLDRALPGFSGQTFDAILLSHVMEHLKHPGRLIDWIAGRIRPAGRLYIECPSEASACQPPRQAFARHGIDLMITNFFDDASHVRIVTPAELLASLTNAGFRIIGSGVIDLGLVGEEMLARGLAGGDAFAAVAGYWSISAWSNWLVACWPEALESA